MAMTSVDVCNLALSQLGGKFIITSLDEDTHGAQLCKAVFEPLRDAVLEEMDWSFATGTFTLTRDPEAASPDGYQRFKLDPQVLRVVEVFTGWGKSEDWRLEGRYVVIASDTVTVRSINRVTDINLYSQAFTQALAARIAAEICVALTNDTNIANYQWQLYASKLQLARTNDSLQGSPRSYSPSRLIRARRGA